MSMMSTLLSPLAGSVREVLAGKASGDSQILDQISTPVGEPGWFEPGDAVWTVHGSVATFLGGIRSLLLQSLHPLALAGVNRHSEYREDPFGRLQRTGAFIAVTTYGPESAAEQAVSGIRRLHGRVNGTLDDGRSYSAGDSRLLMWVHIGLVDSMLAAYVRYGRSGEIDRDAYVADMAVVGRHMGVLDPPTTVSELNDILNGFRRELEYTDETEDMKRFILDAPLPAALKPGYNVLARAALDTLPPWVATVLRERPYGGPARTMRGLAADTSLRTLSLALVKSPAQAAGEQRLGYVEGYV